MSRSRLDASFDELAKLVDGHQTFVLCGHVSVDGDCLGSMHAFYHYLAGLGRDVTVFVHEDLSTRYGFLGMDTVVTVFDPALHSECVSSADVFIAFDLSLPSRMALVAEAIDKAPPKNMVCVDHHPIEGAPFGDLHVIDEAACSTGRLVYSFLKHRAITFTRPMAEGILTAIVSDTGWFRYPNATVETFGAVEDLIPTGVNLGRIHESIYQSNSLALLRLLGRVVAEFHEEAEGRLTWAVIPRSLLDEVGLGVSCDVDVILDVLRSGEGVDTVALFREFESNRVRVNLRSRGLVDVNRVARSFGGGGHRNAAGLSYDGDLHKDARRIVDVLKKELLASVAQE